jgi:hypothetical protein
MLGSFVADKDSASRVAFDGAGLKHLCAAQHQRERLETDRKGIANDSVCCVNFRQSLHTVIKVRSSALGGAVKGVVRGYHSAFSAGIVAAQRRSGLTTS